RLKMKRKDIKKSCKLGDGMVLLKKYISITDQVEIVQTCQEFGKGYRSRKLNFDMIVDKGLPVVSISIGDSPTFLYGHTKNEKEADEVTLQSGDVLIFGGKSRKIFHGKIFHGVNKIISNSAPEPIQESMLKHGRLNLTFRQY
ncbi:oxoglutarate/iron-dependent dioxygenase, partial [Tanacetum coccineum]